MTRYALSPDSRVLVDLRAAGLLRALGHNPTLVAHPEPTTLEAEEGDAGGTTATIAVRFPISRIELPQDMSGDDRDKMRVNMASEEVLDASRFPAVEVTARWRGSAASPKGADSNTRPTMESGRLDVDATVRGRTHALTMDVLVQQAGVDLVARGTWEGRLTDLGIKPFRALMGALKLEDWVRLRLEARLSPT